MTDSKNEVSIPFEAALDPDNEDVLVHGIDGKNNTPAVYGYPLRPNCSGYIPDRPVNWVKQLIFSKEEANSTPQRQDNKMNTKNKDMTTGQWDKHGAVKGTVLNFEAFAKDVSSVAVTNVCGGPNTNNDPNYLCRLN